MNEGKQAALRQWVGLFTGFAIVSIGSVVLNAFLGNILGEYVRYLAWAGAAYLLWMAWNMIRPVLLPGAADEHGHDRSVTKASFGTGLLVQLTNVKIIVFCMTALSSFVLPYTKDFLSLFAVGAVLPFTGPICNLAWLFAGVKLQKLFQQYRTAFSLLMAVSLVFCAITLVC